MVLGLSSVLPRKGHSLEPNFRETLQLLSYVVSVVFVILDTTEEEANPEIEVLSRRSSTSVWDDEDDNLDF